MTTRTGAHQGDVAYYDLQRPRPMRKASYASGVMRLVLSSNMSLVEVLSPNPHIMGHGMA